MRMTSRALQNALAAPLVAASLLAAWPGAACTPSAGERQASFPIDPNPGGTYFKDAGGAPFLINGDSAWSLIGDLDDADTELYLTDRHERRFNTLLVSLIEHRFSRNAPANAYGELPFLDVPFGTLNPAYFDHAEKVIERACELGFLVLLTPAYVGYDGGWDGWWQEMVAAGPERLRAYGREIGARFGRFDNIVWVQGGDYDPPDRDLVRALVEGIDETDPNAVHTAHGPGENRPLAHWQGEDWVDLNNIYTYGPVYKQALQELRLEPDRPFFLIESVYENEYEAKALRVRTEAWQAMLSGASGNVYGNHPVWHFYWTDASLAPVDGDWKEQLSSEGARSMTVLHDALAGLEWWRLRPDVDDAFLLRGHGWRESQHAVAALADDGAFGLVYTPGARRLRVDLARLAPGSISAAWLDPTTGEAHPVEGPLEAGRTSFDTPGPNGFGDEDWVLVLRSAPAPAAAAEDQRAEG